MLYKTSMNLSQEWAAGSLAIKLNSPILD